MKSNRPLVSSCDCHNTDKKPLSRDMFRSMTLFRDNNKCIFCDETENLDAHHIIERRLFDKCGGYHLNNGATVCEYHHKLCEQTVISCDEVRDKIAVLKPVLPEYLYLDHIYDKWGNVIIDDNRRSIGPLFYDESVQKILTEGKVLSLFTKYIKYPRTYHLPFTGQTTEDDKIFHNASEVFKDKEVVITIKMDGENFTGYSDYCHARSLDSGNHESRNWVKTFHFKNIAYNLPEGFRYCAENLYAKHSIHYKDLETYLYAFQIWDKNTCLSWDDTQEWFELLGLQSVPVVFRGTYNEDKIKKLFKETIENGHEGLVIRITDSFSYNSFRHSVGKLVRANHIADGSNHWRFKKIIPNELINEN